MEIIDLKETKRQQNQEEYYINMLVSRKRIEWIACNFKLSSHAEFRFVQRDTMVERDLKSCIRRSPLCWKTIEGTICIAFDLYNYIIVDDRTGEPIIVTFVNAKEKGVNVWETAMVEYKKFVAKGRGV
jgi:hypothetical protein